MNSSKQLKSAIKYMDTIKTLHGDNLHSLPHDVEAFYVKALIEMLTIKPKAQKIEPFITISQYQEEEKLEFNEKQIMLIDKLCRIVCRRDGITIEKREDLCKAYPKKIFKEVVEAAQQIYNNVYIKPKKEEIVDFSYMTIYQYVEEKELEFDAKTIMCLVKLCQIVCERDGLTIEKRGNFYEAYPKKVFDEVIYTITKAYIETDTSNQNDDFTIEDLPRNNNLLE
jgi:hypothetical protein